MKKTIRIARKTRAYRSLHNKVGIILLLLVLVSSVTGILLGWKKNSMGYLQSATATGTTPDPSRWMKMDTLIILAARGLRESTRQDLDTTLDRIDIRPEKGIAKFIYLHHFHAVQVDLATGALLGVEVRRSDWIEKLHDGSLLDYYTDPGRSTFKLLFTTLVGLGLLFLCFSGFWLWFNPKRIRKAKHEESL